MSAKEMKPLSESMARRCEEARGGVCRCRCGGVKHGRSAGITDNGANPLPIEYYNELPDTDPHWLPTPAQKDEAKERKKEAKREAAAIKELARGHYLASDCRQFLDSYREVTLKEYETSGRASFVITNDPTGWRFYKCGGCGKIETRYQRPER